MKDQIENLKTELRKFIELAKAITPGKWSPGSESIWSRNERICGDVETDDMIFIARSRNISPAMAECLLVAVEALEHTSKTQTCLSGSFTIVPTSEAHAAINQLQQILTIWEGVK